MDQPTANTARNHIQAYANWQRYQMKYIPRYNFFRCDCVFSIYISHSTDIFCLYRSVSILIIISYSIFRDIFQINSF